MSAFKDEGLHINPEYERIFLLHEVGDAFRDLATLAGIAITESQNFVEVLQGPVTPKVIQNELFYNGLSLIVARIMKTRDVGYICMQVYSKAMGTQLNEYVLPQTRDDLESLTREQGQSDAYLRVLLDRTIFDGNSSEAYAKRLIGHPDLLGPELAAHLV